MKNIMKLAKLELHKKKYFLFKLILENPCYYFIRSQRIAKLIMRFHRIHFFAMKTSSGLWFNLVGYSNNHPDKLLLELPLGRSRA